MEADNVRPLGERIPGYHYWLQFEHLLRTHLGISPILVRFLVVGGVGYLVNQVVLFLLYDTSVGTFLPSSESEANLLLFSHNDARLLISSVIAVELSIISNFCWHTIWTFRHHGGKPSLKRFLQFNTTSLGSPIISVVILNILTPYFGVYHLIANTVGVLLGTSWNWFCNTQLIWRKRPVSSFEGT
jgi:putative flippase GtrA